MLHFQSETNNWVDGVPREPFPFTPKTVMRPDLTLTFEGLNPGNTSVLRHWWDGKQVFGGTWETNLDRARGFFSAFVDATFRERYAEHISIVEEWNEYIANSCDQFEIEQRYTWAKAAAHVWLYEYRTQPEYAHIRLSICNTAVGNFIPRCFAEICRDYDCVMGYHAYTYWQRGVRPDWEWENLSGLFETMEQEWGIKVPWWLGEVGPFESAVDGWLSSNCLGGDLEMYVNAMRLWMRDVQTTDAYKEGRIIGWSAYTVNRNRNDAFRLFHTNKPEEIEAILRVAMEEWRPGVPPVVIPPVIPPVEPPVPETWPLFTPVYSGRLNVRKGPGIEFAAVGGIGGDSQLRPKEQIDIGPFPSDVWVKWAENMWSAWWYRGVQYLKEVGTDRAPENDPNER